ncbi:RING-type domain-containing protein [Citrus sinensis]|nr:RING-type domain-containing protein [Citrus sinensis]
MASSEAEAQVFLFSICIVLSFIHGGGSTAITCPIKCRINGPEVQFPFRLINQPERCGYPGYDLSCNNMTRTVIQLPNSGEFIVLSIDYLSQTLILNESEPNSCLPGLFLDKSFSLAGSPFDEQEYPSEFTFLNYLSDDQILTTISGLLRIVDLVVVAVPTYYLYNMSTKLSSCSEIKTVSVPVMWPVGSNLTEGVTLKWNVPDCTSCEEGGGFCGFKKGASRDMPTGCANLPASSGLPRVARYGIVIGVGIPGLLCIIGLGCYLCGRFRACYQHRNSDAELGTSITPQLQPAFVPTGLDKPTIESYPKTILGDSGRLPKPNDSTCPICLCEYHPKETLRSIPKCNHYFHAICIDEWLKINATCPLCRNWRENSSVVTPSSSMSLSSSSSSLMAVP